MTFIHLIADEEDAEDIDDKNYWTFNMDGTADAFAAAPGGRALVIGPSVVLKTQSCDNNQLCDENSAPS